VRIAITTSLHPTGAEVDRARAAAARWGLAYAPRERGALAEVRARLAVDGLLVLTDRSAGLFLDAETRAWSPGMGALRAKRVGRLLGAASRAGGTERDPFFEAAGILPGDAVLDCTLGLGADALVAAVAAGPGGRVVGIEGSAALAAWVGEGLARSTLPGADRIEVQAGDHAERLRALPARSFDVVCFDPMFRHARAQPGGFDVVRALADARPLAGETVELARRVARRWVLVKDGAPGWDLARLGLTPLPSARGAHRYFARIAAE
jgi:hypothetical protein